MIAQVWQGSTRAADRHVLASLLQARIQAALARSEACKGGYVLQRQVQPDEVETLMLMLYEGARVVPGGGQEPDALMVPETQKSLLLTCDGSVRYEVLTDPHRMLSYANLSRRFPLRMMVPR